MNGRKIIVLGGGPAGLAAAWKLAEAGQEVVVLESEGAVGGICRTVHRGGYFFDLGGHRFITRDEELSRQIGELMGEELLTTPRRSVIRLRGKYFYYPLELRNLSLNMDKLFLLRSLVDYLAAVTAKKIFNKKDLSFEDWVVNRFGRTLYDIYFGIYTEKLWGIPPKTISADWAAQRISLLNLWDVLLRMLGKRSLRPKTYALEFAYPRMGIGRIAERMAEKISGHGGRILLGARVKKILLQEEVIKKVIYEQAGEEKEICGDWVISTIPMKDFIGGIEPETKKEYLSVARSTKFRAVKFLNLLIDLPQVSDNTWIYIPEKKFLFFRIQEPRNWSSHAAPQGKTSLVLEIACDAGDRVWNAPDKEIFRRCVNDLEEMRLFDTAKIEGHFTTAVKYGYPIYDLDYRGKIRKSMELLRGIANLITIGRQGLFRYNNMDHSIKMGFLTAEHILKGKLDARIFSIGSESVAFEIEKNVEKRI